MNKTSSPLKTLILTYVYVWADNLRETRKATLTYDPSDYSGITDSNALHLMLCEIDTHGAGYTVRFRRATMKEHRAAKTDLWFNLDDA
jgi:hypothetical protein